MVRSKSVALCCGFYGAQVRLDVNFQAHSQKASRICDQLIVNFGSCSSLIFFSIQRTQLSQSLEQARPNWTEIMSSLPD